MGGQILHSGCNDAPEANVGTMDHDRHCWLALDQKIAPVDILQDELQELTIAVTVKDLSTPSRPKLVFNSRGSSLAGSSAALTDTN